MSHNPDETIDIHDDVDQVASQLNQMHLERARYANLVTTSQRGKPALYAEGYNYRNPSRTKFDNFDWRCCSDGCTAHAHTKGKTVGNQYEVTATKSQGSDGKKWLQRVIIRNY